MCIRHSDGRVKLVLLLWCSCSLKGVQKYMGPEASADPVCKHSQAALHNASWAVMDIQTEGRAILFTCPRSPQDMCVPTHTPGRQTLEKCSGMSSILIEN